MLEEILNLIFASQYWVNFWQSHAENALLASAKILVIVVGYVVLRFVLIKLIGGVLNKSLTKLSGDMLHARKARLAALRSMLSSAVSFILAFLAAIMILQAAGINIVPLLTTASIAGLAIGFGAQKLVRDVISGFFILIEDQYGIGDYVTIGLITGEVVELQIRTTRIRDAAGKLYILSNGDITQVCNHSRGDLILTADYSVTSASDVDKARKVLAEVGKSVAAQFPSDIKKPFVCDGMASITPTSNTIRLMGIVVPDSQEKIRFELNQRVREAFAQNDISLA